MQSVHHTCKRKDGSTIYEEKYITERWKDYFYELLNKDSIMNEIK